MKKSKETSQPLRKVSTVDFPILRARSVDMTLLDSVKERLLLTEAAWKKSDQRNSELEKQVTEARVDKENDAKAMEVPYIFLFSFFSRLFC